MAADGTFEWLEVLEFVLDRLYHRRTHREQNATVFENAANPRRDPWYLKVGIPELKASVASGGTADQYRPGRSPTLFELQPARARAWTRLSDFPPLRFVHVGNSVP